VGSGAKPLQPTNDLVNTGVAALMAAVFLDFPKKTNIIFVASISNYSEFAVKQETKKLQPGPLPHRAAPDDGFSPREVATTIALWK